jgi:hypothetical protein
MDKTTIRSPLGIYNVPNPVIIIRNSIIILSVETIAQSGPSLLFNHSVIKWLSAKFLCGAITPPQHSHSRAQTCGFVLVVFLFFYCASIRTKISWVS